MFDELTMDNEAQDVDKSIDEGETETSEDAGEPGSEATDDESETQASVRDHPLEETSSETIKVAVDWVEFEGALENNSPDLRSFLNKITGDVIRVFESGDGSELKLRQTEESDDFLFIEPISSREQYRWMEEFIEVVEEPTLKDKLNIAIDGKGAFRRFKDVLMAYPVERERWFAKRSSKLHAHMVEWLKSKNVESTNTPPWEAQDSGSRKRDDRKGRGDSDSRNWRDNSSDLRSLARDLIDLIPSRELPSAVAFLEFLKARRSFRRPNNYN
jgi:hypothetical protein